MSLAAPAANGTTARIVRSGQLLCAVASWTRATSKALAAPQARMDGMPVLPYCTWMHVHGCADFERCPAWRRPLATARVSSIGVPVCGAIRLPVTFSPGVHRVMPGWGRPWTSRPPGARTRARNFLLGFFTLVNARTLGSEFWTSVLYD